MRISIKKLGMDFDVPAYADLPEATQQHLVEYGWKQKLSDGLSDMSTKGMTGDKLAKVIADGKADVEAKIKDLVAGVIRASRVGASADPVRAEAMANARRDVKASTDYRAWVAANAGGKPNALIAVAERDKRATELVDNTPRYMATAAKIVALRTEVSDVEA